MAERQTILSREGSNFIPIRPASPSAPRDYTAQGTAGLAEGIGQFARGVAQAHGAWASVEQERNERDVADLRIQVENIQNKHRMAAQKEINGYVPTDSAGVTEFVSTTLDKYSQLAEQEISALTIMRGGKRVPAAPLLDKHIPPKLRENRWMTSFAIGELDQATRLSSALKLNERHEALASNVQQTFELLESPIGPAGENAYKESLAKIESQKDLITQSSYFALKKLAKDSFADRIRTWVASGSVTDARAAVDFVMKTTSIADSDKPAILSSLRTILNHKTTVNRSDFYRHISTALGTPNNGLRTQNMNAALAMFKNIPDDDPDKQTMWAELQASVNTMNIIDDILVPGRWTMPQLINAMRAIDEGKGDAYLLTEEAAHGVREEYRNDLNKAIRTNLEFMLRGVRNGTVPFAAAMAANPALKDIENTAYDRNRPATERQAAWKLMQESVVAEAQKLGLTEQDFQFSTPAVIQQAERAVQAAESGDPVSFVETVSDFVQAYGSRAAVDAFTRLRTGDAPISPWTIIATFGAKASARGKTSAEKDRITRDTLAQFVNSEEFHRRRNEARKGEGGSKGPLFNEQTRQYESALLTAFASPTSDLSEVFFSYKGSLYSAMGATDSSSFANWNSAFNAEYPEMTGAMQQLVARFAIYQFNQPPYNGVFSDPETDLKNIGIDTLHMLQNIAMPVAVSRFNEMALSATAAPSEEFGMGAFFNAKPGKGERADHAEMEGRALSLAITSNIPDSVLTLPDRITRFMWHQAPASMILGKESNFIEPAEVVRYKDIDLNSIDPEGAFQWLPAFRKWEQGVKNTVEGTELRAQNIAYFAIQEYHVWKRNDDTQSWDLYIHSPTQSNVSMRSRVSPNEPIRVKYKDGSPVSISFDSVTGFVRNHQEALSNLFNPSDSIFWKNVMFNTLAPFSNIPIYLSGFQRDVWLKDTLPPEDYAKIKAAEEAKAAEAEARRKAEDEERRRRIKAAGPLTPWGPL